MPADPKPSEMANPAGDIPSPNQAPSKPAGLIDDATMTLNEATALSLPAQICKVEQQIILRRQLVSRNANRLSGDIRQRLVAPATLLTIVGVGLAIGVLLNHRIHATDNPALTHGRETQSGTKLARLFTNTLKATAMARTLAVAFPRSMTCRTQPKQGSGL